MTIMPKATRRTETTVTVGACPSCAEPLEASVASALTMGEPVIAEDGTVTAPEVTVETTGARVVHRCGSYSTRRPD